MPVEAATATDLKDLLDKLRIFTTANGWVQEEYNTTAGLESEDELFLRGLGSTDSERVHVIISTFGDAFNDIFTWRIRAATGYDSSQPRTLQPNVSPECHFTCSDNAMNYWFYVSDRRIIVVIQSGTSFFAMYAGFFLPNATPIEYPFPLYIGATADGDQVVATLNAGSRNFADPGQNAAFLRDPSGLWAEVWNHGTQANLDDRYNLAGSGQDYTVAPFNNGGGNSSTPDTSVNFWDIRPSAGAPTALPVFPLQLFATRFGLPNLGTLENAFMVPGFGLTSNQTFQLGTSVANGLLTITGNASAGETVTIGGSVAARATLVATANFANAETVVIDGKTYTFQTTLTDSDGNVLIGPDAQTSLANLVAAINLAAGSGTTYAASTTVHPTVSAASLSTDRMVATAKSAGTAGNAITVSETGANAYWASVALIGGRNANVYRFQASITQASPDYDVLIGATAAETRDHLLNAINGGPGRGLEYSEGTPFNNDAYASVSGAQNLRVDAREFGAGANSIATTETMTNASFGAATLTGGGGNETYRIFQNVARSGRNHFWAVLEV